METGRFVSIEKIKESALPIDNVSKFAWLPEDIEVIQEWREWSAEELASMATSEEAKQTNAQLQEEVNSLKEELASVLASLETLRNMFKF